MTSLNVSLLVVMFLSVHIRTFAMRENRPEFVILDEEFAEQLRSWPKYVAM